MEQSKMNMFLNLPEIETKRLLLRKMLPIDATDMYEYSSSLDVTRYLLWSPHSTIGITKLYLNNLQREYSKGRHREWALIYKDNNKMIGTCGYTRIDEENKVAELGYVLNPEYWGMGIACEAAQELIGIAFDNLDMERVEIRYIAENFSSRRVGEKCGMTFEGVLRHYMLIKGVYCDIGICSILRNDYYKNNLKKDRSYLNYTPKRFMFKL